MYFSRRNKTRALLLTDANASLMHACSVPGYNRRVRILIYYDYILFIVIGAGPWRSAENPIDTQRRGSSYLITGTGRRYQIGREYSIAAAALDNILRLGEGGHRKTLETAAAVGRVPLPSQYAKIFFNSKKQNPLLANHVVLHTMLLRCKICHVSFSLYMAATTTEYRAWKKLYRVCRKMISSRGIYTIWYLYPLVLLTIRAFSKLYFWFRAPLLPYRWFYLYKNTFWHRVLNAVPLLFFKICNIGSECTSTIYRGHDETRTSNASGHKLNLTSSVIG